MRITGMIMTVLTVTIVTALSLSRSVSMPSGMPLRDKGAHFIAYAAIGFSLFLCVCNGNGKNATSVAIAVLGGSCFGAAIELIQPSFGRSGELLDLLMDFAGSLTGGLLAALAVWYLNKMRAKRLVNQKKLDR